MFVFFLFLFPLDELSDLRAENANLRRENIQLKKLVELAEFSGFIPEGDGFKSIIAMLNALPDELAVPDDRKWSEIEFQQVKSGLAKYAGRPFETRVPVNSVEIKENPERSTDLEAPKFLITVTLGTETFPYKGKKFVQQIGKGSFGTKVYFTGDDDMVRAAVRLKRRKTAVVNGTISGVEIITFMVDTYKVNILLEDQRFDWPDK